MQVYEATGNNPLTAKSKQLVSQNVDVVEKKKKWKHFGTNDKNGKTHCGIIASRECAANELSCYPRVMKLPEFRADIKVSNPQNRKSAITTEYSVFLAFGVPGTRHYSIISAPGILGTYKCLSRFSSWYCRY